MIFLVSAILFASAALFVGYPLFKREQLSDNTEPLPINETAVLSMIEELELDYQMGNISEEEYRKLDSEYMNSLN